MARDLISMLSMPLREPRGYRIEAACCREPRPSPIRFPAARRPTWLLSDLAVDQSCRRCHAMPALTLLPQDRVGLPIKSAQVGLVDRFDKGVVSQSEIVSLKV